MSITPSNSDQVGDSDQDIPMVNEVADAISMVNNIRGLISDSMVLVQDIQTEMNVGAVQPPISAGTNKFYKEKIEAFLRTYSCAEGRVVTSLSGDFLISLGSHPKDQPIPYLALVRCTYVTVTEAEHKLNVFFNQQQTGNRWRENGHMDTLYKNIQKAPWPTKQDILEMKVMTTDALKRCYLVTDMKVEQKVHRAELREILNMALQILVLLDCVQFQKGLAARMETSLLCLRELGRSHRLRSAPST